MMTFTCIACGSDDVRVVDAGGILLCRCGRCGQKWTKVVMPEQATPPQLDKWRHVPEGGSRG